MNFSSKIHPMVILYYILLFFFSLLITWGVLRLVHRRTAPSCQSYALVGLAGTFTPLLLVLIGVLIISAVEFQGICYGFTDGTWPCTFSEYLTSQLFWGMLVFLFPMILAWISTSIMLAVSWVKFQSSAQDTPPDSPE